MNTLSATVAIENSLVTPTFERDSYGALHSDSVPASMHALLKAVIAAAGIRVGITRTNKRGGYDAQRVDIYGYDVERNLIAIQIRHTWLRKEGYWIQQKKYYALAGVDEGQIFCHVIPSSFRQMKDLAEATPGAVVKWAESKIFRVPLARLNTIIRQGDIALVPVRSIPRSASLVQSGTGRLSEVTLRSSHAVKVDGQLYKDAESGRIWTEGLVQIDHEPGQHRSIDAEGRFEIVEGERLDVSLNTVD